MSKKRTTKDVISEFKSIHGDLYDYSEFEYGGIREEGRVICQEHGAFLVTPINHRRGMKCPVCSETFKSKCIRLGVNYYRALKRRQAGHSEEKIFSKRCIRNECEINKITIYGKQYPNLREAVRLLNPPASPKALARWMAEGMSPEEAFERIPNPGYADGIIYLITDNIVGKQYVGLTVQTLERRWKYHIEQAHAKHIKTSGSLHAAIRVYGKGAFNIKEIDRGTTKKDLESKERKWIKDLNTLVPEGYNISTGGVSGGSDKKPTIIDGTRFDSVGKAAEHVAETKGISFSAAKKRIQVGRIDVVTPAKTGDSLVKKKAYKAWSRIKHSVMNPNSKDFIQGISICEEWQDFNTFYKDVGEPPQQSMAFTRLDKSKGFYPSNCNWLTKSESSKINAAYMKEHGKLTGRKKRIA